MSQEITIACIGDACFDYIATGIRKFPKWGCALPFQELHKSAGGQAVNCALALRKLGGTEVYPLVRIGKDSHGAMIRESLASNGIDSSVLMDSIVEDEFPTTSVLVFVNSQQSKDRAFLYTEQPTSCTPGLNHLMSRLPALQSSAACHFTCVGQFPCLTSPEIAPFMSCLTSHSGKKPLITADTSPVELLRDVVWQRAIGQFLRYVDYFFPADVEAAWMTNLPQSDYRGCAAKLKETYGIPNVCIKIHDRGVFCLDELGNEHLIEPLSLVDVADTTGAGDAWCAGFLHAKLVRSMLLTDSFHFANAVANFCIRSIGATSNIPNGSRVLEILDPGRNNRIRTVKTSVFISYRWENPEHKDWVSSLAKKLMQEQFDVIFDQWNSGPGDQLPVFMEQSVNKCDFVIAVCSPAYKQSSDNRIGGVGSEVDLFTGDVLLTGNHRKVIPVLRSAEWSEAAPSWAKGKYYIDLSGDPYSEKEYSKLVSALRGEVPNRS